MHRPACTCVLIVLGALGMGFCAYAAFAAARTTDGDQHRPDLRVHHAAGGELRDRRRASARELGGCWPASAPAWPAWCIILTRGHPETLLHLTFTHRRPVGRRRYVVFAGYTVALRRTPTTLTPLAQFVCHEHRRDAGPAAVLRRGGGTGRDSADHARHAALAGELWYFWPASAHSSGTPYSLMRNGPVLTAASISLTPIYAAGLAIGLIGEQLAWYHGGGAGPGGGRAAADQPRAGEVDVGWVSAVARNPTLELTELVGLRASP